MKSSMTSCSVISISLEEKDPFLVVYVLVVGMVVVRVFEVSWKEVNRWILMVLMVLIRFLGNIVAMCVLKDEDGKW